MPMAELAVREPGASLYLDFALETSRIAPETSLQFVETATELGVSAYGHFVGSQAYIRAQCALNNPARAFERYVRMRGGQVGHPPYLDRFLLNGLSEGNEYRQTEVALRAIQRHRRSDLTSGIEFPYRRALMAVGRYDEVADHAPRAGNSRVLSSHNLGTYSEVFHEAPALLRAGQFSEMSRRAGRFVNHSVNWPDSIGVCADALVLFAIARRLDEFGDAESILTEDGRVELIAPALAYFHLQSPWLLDLRLMRILAGREEPTALPLDDPDWHWHGSRYSERPFVSRGTAILTGPQLAAREQFIHGVIHWLRDDPDKAREHLKACVAADQRFSHEYHVATWLLSEHLED
jgi:hypothetical protein